MGEFNNVMNLDAEMLVIGNLTKNSEVNTDGKPLPSALRWQEVSQVVKDQYFYSTKFKLNKVSADKVITAKTLFYNPKNKTNVLVYPSYKLDFTKLDGEPRRFQGPIEVFPEKDQPQAVGMSIKLMKALSLNDGDVVYFNLFT
jgi:hypothetical protein